MGYKLQERPKRRANSLQQRWSSRQALLCHHASLIIIIMFAKARTWKQSLPSNETNNNKAAFALRLL